MAAAVRVARDEWGREGGGVKRSGAQRGSVGRAARGCMGGGMEEAATKRAAKGAVRARREKKRHGVQCNTNSK